MSIGSNRARVEAPAASDLGGGRPKGSRRANHVSAPLLIMIRNVLATGSSGSHQRMEQDSAPGAVAILAQGLSPDWGGLETEPSWLEIGGPARHLSSRVAVLVREEATLQPHS